MTPEEITRKLGEVGLVNPLQSLAVGAIAYAGAFLMAIVAVVLSVVAIVVNGLGNPVDSALESVDMDQAEAGSGVASLLRLPFQLVAMATFGSFDVDGTIEGVSFGAGLRILPFGITLVMVLLAFYGGRFVQKRQRAGLLGIWTTSVLTGFGVALFTVLSAFILAERVPAEAGASISLHAAGFDTFFGAFALITLSLALGRLTVRARRSWWPLVADLPAAFKLAVSHALIVTVLGLCGVTIVSTIQALIDGETPPMIYVLLLLPLIGGHVLSFVTGLDMLSAATANIDGAGALSYLMDGMNGTERATMFSLPWYTWLGGLLLGGLALLLASLLWQHQRRIVPHHVVSLGVSWIALPAAYFLGGLVLLVLSQASVAAQLSGGGFFFGDMRIGASVGLAAWTPLLAMMAGVIVELLSRFVAPFLTPFLPSAALSWFRRPLAPAAAGVTSGAVGAAGASSAAGPAGSGPLTYSAPLAGAAPDGGFSLAPSAQGIPTDINADGVVEAGTVSAQHAGQAQAHEAVPTSADGTAAAGRYATVPIGATAGALSFAGAAGAAGADGSTAEPGAAGNSTGKITAAAASLSPRTRKLVLAGAVVVGAGIVLVIGLIVTFVVLSNTVFSPEKRVEAYLGAVQAGDAEQALEIAAPNVPTAQQALLTNDIAGAAENRISDFEIVGSEESGSKSATVTAKVTQDGVTTTRTYRVDRSGRTAVVFPDWTMAETEYATLALVIPDGAATLLVNGQEVAVSDLDTSEGYYAPAAVLPGQYTVTLPESSELVAAVESVAYVSADPDDWYELYAAPGYSLSESGMEEVQTQVDALLDECATSTEESPDGCPFRAYAYGVVEDSGSWTIDSYPTVEVEESDEGWYFGSSSSAGAATYSYQKEGWGSDDEPTDETDESSFSVSGTVTVGEDGTVAVEFDDGWW
ncbi:hypothetical protein ACTXPC_05840 [Brachybacterium alimentarium]|uniref:hypothetical protein n=1 Tax=Brachybacterium alimentarium TaxID=47845 RepID=UPI003FD156FD